MTLCVCFVFCDFVFLLKESSTSSSRYFGRILASKNDLKNALKPSSVLKSWKYLYQYQYACCRAGILFSHWHCHRCVVSVRTVLHQFCFVLFSLAFGPLSPSSSAVVLLLVFPFLLSSVACN